jgi:hypothetical protein
MNIAQTYIELGLSVIPLGKVSKDAAGKKVIQYPKNGWKRFSDERASLEEASQWNGNLGIATGRVSGILVLDIDSYKPGFDASLVQSLRLPPTVVQETASGGKQYFFKYPAHITIKNAVCIGHDGSGVDIRGDGGMVIAPPTKTSYGEYRWLLSPEDTEIAEVPPKLLEMLKVHASPETRKELGALVSLAEGEGRDNAMTALVGKLVMTARPEQWAKEVWPAMVEVNRTYKPPLTEADLKRIYTSITEKELKRRKGSTAAKPEPKPFVPAMSFKALMATEYPAARFTVDPFFEAGTLNMISAPPNTWKSWIMMIFAGAIAEGGKALGKFDTEKAGVMIVNEEDSHRALQDRFRILGMAGKDIEVYLRIAEGAKLEDVYITQLIAEAKALKIGVIMFDSLRAVHDSEENDSTEMQKVLDKLKAIAREGITVIFTHHHRKKGPFEKGDSPEMSRGSSAINAAISGHLSFEEEERDSGKYVIVRHLKSKAGEKMAPFELKIEKKGEELTFAYSGDFKSTEKKLVNAKDSVVRELEGGGWKTAKDFISLGIASKNVVRVALQVLVKEGVIMSMTRRDAIDRKMDVGGTGKSNELVYSMNTARDSFVDEEPRDPEDIFAGLE